MTLKVGDRVRVHADGGVVLVDHQLEPKLKVTMHRPADDGTWDRTTQQFVNRTAWFHSDEVELTDKPLVKDNGWRDACADMIREGKDPDALKQLVENSTFVSAIIKRWRALESAFSVLPAPEIFANVWKQVARLNYEPTITAYEHACACYRALYEWRIAAAADEHVGAVIDIYELVKEPE